MNNIHILKAFNYSRIMIHLMVYIIFCFLSIASNASQTATQKYSDGVHTYNTYVPNYTTIKQNTQSAVTTALKTTGNALSSAFSGFVYASPKITLNPFSIDMSPCFVSQWSVASPNGNSIFNPQIRVHNKTIVMCFGYQGTVTLNAWGQCKFIGIIRTCARFTPPGQYGNTRCTGSDTCSPASPNNNSCPNCAANASYRICAFEDPAIPFDPNDNNLSLMPYHLKTPVPPTVTGGSQIVEIGAMVTLAGLIVPGLGEGTMLIGAAIMVAGGIMELAQVITSTINYTVVGNRGCVDTPMAPSPPAYFSTLVSPLISANAVSICSYQQTSTSNAQCEIGGTLGASPAYSNFENPAIRVYFTNPVPLCETPSTNSADLCVNGTNISTPDALSAANQSLLPICSSSVTSNCINFPSSRTSGSPFRTNYNLINSNSNPISMSPSTYVSVNSTPGYALTLSGINDSEYADIAAGQSVDIYDIDNTKRSFSAAFDETGTHICVLDSTLSTDDPVTVGCAPRPLMSVPPVVSAYTGQPPAISTQPLMQVSVGSPAKTGVFGVDLAIPDPNNSGSYLPPTAFCVTDDITSNGNSTSNQAPCYLYGAQFSTYITDNYNRTSTSSGNGNITPAASGSGYTGGLQYVNGRYCNGATQICLSGYTNPTQKVVTRMISNGKDPTTGLPTYTISDDIRDRVIPPYNSTAKTQTLIDTSGSPTVTLFNPATNYYPVTGGTNQVVVVGTKDPTSGLYIQNAACNTNDTSCIATSTNYPSSVQCTCRITTAPPGESCQVQGCDAAFQTTATSSAINYTAYTNGTTTYPFLNSCCTQNKCSTGYNCACCATNTCATGYDCSCCNANTCPSESGKPYDCINVYGERTLNSVEMGLCTPIPVQTCAAISTSQISPNDGNATWPLTNAGNNATGTCTHGTAQNSNGPPTRTCNYVSTGTRTNGCPTYTVAFGTVDNACTAPMPSWWPGQFLYANTNFQGAIINQFSVRYDYRSMVGSGRSFTPSSYNADPFNLLNGNPTAPEPWNSTYDSCSKNGLGTSSNYARNTTNGDAEMLYLTNSQWNALWANNDMKWLLADSSQTANDGCYVYNLNGQINASYSNNVIPGMKICKYQDKVSFSLVDLGANAATDYTNNAYIMQSNVIGYSAYISDNIQKDGSAVLTNNLSGYNKYNVPVNTGIVILRSGFNFGSAQYYNSGVLPSLFQPISKAESISVQYEFSIHYKGKHGSPTRHNECTNFNPGGCNATGQYTNAYTCPLSIYRNNMDLSSPTTAASYLNNASNNTSSNYYFSPNNTALFVPKCCDDDHDEQQDCHLAVVVNSYTSGNSAANSSMFYWSGPTSYNVCNQ